MSLESIELVVATNYKLIKKGIWFLNICPTLVRDQVLSFRVEVAFCDWLYKYVLKV